MRTYDEMFQSVLVRRDAYRAAQTVRRRKLRYVTAFSAAAALCCLLTVTAAKLMPGRLPTMPPAPDTTIAATDTTQPTETESAMTETSATEAAAAKATEPNESADTEPATDPAEHAETAVPTEAAQPVTSPQATEPVRPATEAPAITTEAPTAPPTVAQTEPVTEALENGFVVEHLDGCKRIVCIDALPAKSGTLQRYELHSDAFELVGVNEGSDVNEYRIRPIGQETEFTVTQQEYEDFSLIVDEDAEISVNISLGRRRGFFVLQGDTCTLYWFEGSEGFCISGADKDLQYLMAISRGFVPVEQ